MKVSSRALSDALALLFIFWQDEYHYPSDLCLRMVDQDGYFLPILYTRDELTREIWVDVDLELRLVRATMRDIPTDQIYIHDEYYLGDREMLEDLQYLSYHDFLAWAKWSIEKDREEAEE